MFGWALRYRPGGAETCTGSWDWVTKAGVARCYTGHVPTTRPRHAVTETGAVADALEALRAEPGGGNVSVSELVVIGARTLTAQKRAQRDADDALLTALAESVLSGGPALADPQAADQVRFTGWARSA